eukprot:scaffold23944_cov37-Phaeocystis_antarctica.AAC.2
MPDPDPEPNPEPNPGPEPDPDQVLHLRGEQPTSADTGKESAWLGVGLGLGGRGCGRHEGGQTADTGTERTQNTVSATAIERTPARPSAATLSIVQPSSSSSFPFFSSPPPAISRGAHGARRAARRPGLCAATATAATPPPPRAGRAVMGMPKPDTSALKAHTSAKAFHMPTSRAQLRGNWSEWGGNERTA